MSWKNWPSWLKGGMIGLVISIFVGLLSGISPIFNEIHLLSGISVWLQYIFYAIPLSILGNWRWSFLHYCDYRPPELCPPNINTFIINGLIIFVIGVIIGWIYGKIKSKKRRK